MVWLLSLLWSLVNVIIQIIPILFVIVVIMAILSFIVEWILDHLIQIIIGILFIIAEVVSLANGRFDIAVGLLVGVVILNYIVKTAVRYFYKRQKKRTRAKIVKWKNKGGKRFVDIDKVMIDVVDKIKMNASNSNYFDYTDMPYGRAVAFISNFENNIEDEEFYFFLPQDTKDPFDVRENGVLIAKTGIYFIYEQKSDENSNEKYNMCKYSILFKNCFSYDPKYNCIRMINATQDGFEDIYLSKVPIKVNGMLFGDIIDTIVKNKIPQHLNYYNLADRTDVKNLKLDRSSALKRTIRISSITASGKTRKNTYRELRNYMNGRQGGGYAAEYGNNTIDLMMGKEVINAAQVLDPVTGRQVKDGADRIVNRVSIQTKYHNKFSSFYADAFPDGSIRYKCAGKPMKIEVPRDKYQNFCYELQKRIDNGDIKDLPGDARATDILKKGHLTYDAAQNIAKSGTIESISIDAGRGIICTIPYATISVLFVFAESIWNGKSEKEAFENACYSFAEIAGTGTLIYVLTNQLTRANSPIYGLCSKLTTEIKRLKFSDTVLGKKMGLNTLQEKELMNSFITVAVIFGPDIHKYFIGKISREQLIKNSMIASSTVAGSKVGETVGAAIGGPAVFVTAPVGAIIGGVLAGSVAKVILDKYIEDDVIKMFKIFKEEFINIVTLAGLSQNEFEEVAALTLTSQDFPGILNMMFTREDPRTFAKEYIKECVVLVIKKRKKVSNRDCVKGVIAYFISYLGEDLKKSLEI